MVIENRNNKILLTTALFFMPVVFILLSLCIGRYPLSPVKVFKILLQGISPDLNAGVDIYHNIVWQIRMPRAILGGLVGGALGISGAALQGLFKNPLVSPGILGVSSGAGFGAAVAILISGATAVVYPFALVFGILAVFFSYLIGRTYNTAPAIMLVLGGVIVSSMFSALISFAKYIADPYNQLPSIVFWLMGSLANAGYEDIYTSGPIIIAGSIGLYLIRWRINVLSMGDREARTLGIDTKITKGIVVTGATLATAGAVCVSGTIGWIGLIIPHIGRMLAGNDNRILIPVSFSLGACFLMAVDILSRVLTGSEIPLGILTSLIGGPFFIYLLKKTKAKGW
jgi:iron complex transport system permease protein